MHPTSICIVARPMTRPATRRAHCLPALFVVLASTFALAGCEDLDGRASNRKGNRLFREGRFIDSAALYEDSLKKVKDDKIEYNLGLAYSRIFKGTEEPVLVAEAGSFPCTTIPNTTPTKRSVCVKKDPADEDRAYPDCKTNDDCPESARCALDLDLCAIDNKVLADLSAQHLTIWIAKQAPDDEIRKRDEELTKELTELEKVRDDSELEAEKHRDPKTGKFTDKGAYEDAMQRKTAADEKIKIKKEEIEENRLKFTMRTLMTNLLVDSGQHDKALAYWDAELKARPNDFEAMGKLAGINLKAGNYRKAIEWYLIIGEKVPEDANKITAYSSVGNVAWAKLNSKTLNPDESVELADLGIGALQKASALAPKNPTFLRLQGALYNFRGLTHGASWAAAIDRASAQDLKGQIDVVTGKAQPPSEKPAPPTPPTPPATPTKGGSGTGS